MQATIPFHGFYNSIHDAAFNSALEQEGREVGDVDWRKAFRGYAAEFAKQFLHEINIQGQFDRLESPREYNFTTDRIFVEIPLPEVVRMLAEVDPETLNRVAEERHASRSGFSSFYSPRVGSWGPVETWDCNQVGTLLQAYAGEDLDWAIAETLECNGVVDRLIGY